MTDFRESNLQKRQTGNCWYRAKSINDPGWINLTKTCLEKPEFRDAAISLVLTMSDPPVDLLELVLQKLKGLTELIENICLSTQISENVVLQLLRHEDQAVAIAAARGEWSAEPVRTVRDSLREDWENIVIKHTENGHWLGEVLGNNPTLAYKWLQSRIEDQETVFFGYEIAFSSAANALDIDDKLRILDQLPDRYGFDELIFDLVGGNIDLYRELLERENLKQYHLIPLSGKPSGIWIELAKMALDAGYNVKEVSQAVYHLPLTSLAWVGNESDMWEGWVEVFEQLCQDDDERIQDIGKEGKDYALKQKEQAFQQERREAVYGMHW